MKTRNLPLLKQDSAIDIETENLTAGTYIIQLEQEGRLIQTEKLILQP